MRAHFAKGNIKIQLPVGYRFFHLIETVLVIGFKDLCEQISDLLNATLPFAYYSSRMQSGLLHSAMHLASLRLPGS
jgi:hypothetical protein